MPRLPVPSRGITNATADMDIPPGFAAVGSMQNVVPYTAPNDRPDLGQRPGLKRRFSARLGTDSAPRVQGLGVITRASSVTSYSLGQTKPVNTANARTARAALVNANLWAHRIAEGGLIDSARVFGSAGAARVVQESDGGAGDLAGIASGFPTTAEPRWIAVHPGGTLAAAAFPYTASSQNRTAILFFDPRSMLVLGSALIAPGGELVGDASNVAQTCAVFTDTQLIVARGRRFWRIPVQSVGGLTAPLVANPSPVQENLGSLEMPAVGRVTGLAATKLSAGWRIVACFIGTPDAGTFDNPGGVVASGRMAQFYRSGVHAFNEAADGSLSVVPIGRTPIGSDPYVETSGGIPVVHNSLRFSTVLNRAPRGALPSAIASNATGGFFVAFSNRGWGPTTAFPPDQSATPSVLAAFDDAGTYRWEIDLDSVIGGERGGNRSGDATTGYATDAPNEVDYDVPGGGPIEGPAGTTTHDGPAIRAVAVDSSGLVYAAGRVGSGRFNVFAVEPAGGLVRWRARTESNNPTDGGSNNPAWVAPGTAGAGTPYFGIAADPAGGLIVVGRRNNTWGTTDRSDIAVPVVRHANVFKLSAIDGTIQWAVSPVNDNASASGVSNLAPRCVGVGSSVAVVGTGTFGDT